ncbi:MAG: amphi-Trp domain-containing protein [Roseovarius sp.]|nr:amphi-Trp domain-containing protein [Roseovarius sp.]
MTRETVLFSAKDTRPRSGIAAFLRDMADKIESGSVTLRQGEIAQDVVLPDYMVLEIKLEDEHKGKRGIRHCLEIEMKWYDDMGAPAGIVLE